MSAPSGIAASGTTASATDFLIVDEFLKTLIDARALKSALDIGLIDRLEERGAGAASAAAVVSGLDLAGSRLLLDLLIANNVLREDRGDVRLTRHFRTALRYRDLLEIKLDYAAFAMEDFTNLFDPLVRSAGRFQERARIFDLFDYRRALSAEGENYLRTRQWMRIVSVLTHHEAVACLNRFDISGFRRMLDIGGNSGEFVRRFCERNPELRGTVFDLPLVCDVGLEHVLPSPEAERIGFVRGDARSDPFPEGADLITFKSMLHDWPGAEATRFLEKAARALAPGGSLMIFERGELRLNGVTPPWSMLPNLLFFRSYRPPETYMRVMLESGLQDVRREDVELDSTFHIVSGRKPR